MNPANKNAVGACNTYDINRNCFQVHYNTAGQEGDSPPGLRAAIPNAELDRVFAPVWQTLSRAQGRTLFRALGGVMGQDRLFTLLGASYLRFLQGKEMA